MAELTEYDEIRLKEIFESLDVDKCGGIYMGDLRTGSQLFGLNPNPEDLEEAKSSLTKHDDDKNGVLSYEQFSELIVNLNKSNEEIQNELDAALCLIMEKLGLQKDDKISKDNLKAILKERGNDHLTEEEVDEIFNDMDKVGDSDTATRKELVDLFTRDF